MQPPTPRVDPRLPGARPAPAGAGIQAALLDRVRDVVPVPEVRQVLAADGGLPQALVMELMPGDRGDLVLARLVAAHGHGEGWADGGLRSLGGALGRVKGTLAARPAYTCSPLPARATSTPPGDCLVRAVRPYRVGMAELAPYTITPGSLAGLTQPTLPLPDGVRLRPWRLADAAALQEAYADPDIQRWHVRRIDSLDEARGMIAGWQRAWAQERRLEWAVEDADTTLLGRLALKDLALFDGVAEVAYWTVPAARGRGVASQAVAAASRWADDAGFRRLELEHSTLNPASCRVAEKSGFVLEGTRRGAARHADGHHDMHAHARLADGGGADD